MGSSHLLLGIFLALGLVGCTSKDNPATPPSVNVVIDGASPDRSLIEANKEIILLKERLNADSTYKLTASDISLLKSENILASDSDVKMWVK